MRFFVVHVLQITLQTYGILTQRSIGTRGVGMPKAHGSYLTSEYERREEKN
jgi:hypothetical protein